MYAIDYAKYLGIPISRGRRLLPEAGERGTGGYQYLRETPCDYMRTDVIRFVGQALLPKPRGSCSPASFSLGGFKLWTTIRDIERLGLDRMAQEDKAILAVPDVQDAVRVARRPSDCRPERSTPSHGSSPAV